MSLRWADTTIGEIAIVDWGNTNLTKKAFVEDGPYLGVSAAGCDGRMEHAEHKKLTPVLSAIGAQCGRMFLPDEDFTAIKNTITLTPKSSQTDPIFLYYLMTFVELPQRGAGQPFISKGDIQKFSVSVPPLEEQKRIVVLLDQAFAALDRARANAEANLADAEELWGNSLDAMFSELEPKSKRLSLFDVCVIGDGNHSSKYPKSAEMVESGVPFLRSSNIQNGKIDATDLLHISPAKHEQLKKGHLQAGDVLFTNRGEIGKVAIVPAEFDGSNLNSQVAWLRCKDEIASEFLYFYLQSGKMRRHYINQQSGAALQQFPIKMIKAIEVIVPSKFDQTDAIAKLNGLRSHIKAAAIAYDQQARDIDNLRQSIFQKAFAGELT